MVLVTALTKAVVMCVMCVELKVCVCGGGAVIYGGVGEGGAIESNGRLRRILSDLWLS